MPSASDFRAGVTQLVEFLPSKQVVAGSCPVSRSTKLGDYLPGLRRYYRLTKKGKEAPDYTWQ